MSDNLCTERQAALLEKHGYDSNVSFDEASRIIDQLAANGWKRPARGQAPPARGQQQGRRAPSGPPARGRGPAPQQSRDAARRQGQQRRNGASGGGYGNGRRQAPQQDGGDRCTDRQAKVLEDFGYNPDEFTFAEASALIQQLKDNNWQPLESGPDEGNDYYDDDAPDFN